LCPRAYLRVPDHGDPHLLPCCGYLPWRSIGLNTDSWRPPWGHRHDRWVNSKDIHLKINVRQRRRDELAACSSTTRCVLVSRFNLLSAIGIHDRFDPYAVSWRNLKEPTTCARVRSRGSIWSLRVSRKKFESVYVTEPLKLIPHYRLNPSSGSLSNNTEVTCHLCRVVPGKSLTSQDRHLYNKLTRRRVQR
jgi:hypothetical protein